jgi:hypothetical protein
MIGTAKRHVAEKAIKDCFDADVEISEHLRNGTPLARSHPNINDRLTQGEKILIAGELQHIPRYPLKEPTFLPDGVTINPASIVVCWDNLTPESKSKITKDTEAHPVLMKKVKESFLKAMVTIRLSSNGAVQACLAISQEWEDAITELSVVKLFAVAFSHTKEHSLDGACNILDQTISTRFGQPGASSVQEYTSFVGNNIDSLSDILCPGGTPPPGCLWIHPDRLKALTALNGMRQDVFTKFRADRYDGTGKWAHSIADYSEPTPRSSTATSMSRHPGPRAAKLAEPSHPSLVTSTLRRPSSSRSRLLPFLLLGRLLPSRTRSVLHKARAALACSRPRRVIIPTATSA